MKVNYFISARAEEQVQGINVSLSTEFDKGNLPKFVNFNASGSIEGGSNPVYMNANGSYDVENEMFSNLNSSYLPSGFLEDLEVKVKEFHNLVKTEQGA